MTVVLHEKQMPDLAAIRVLFRAPDTLGLYGIPYEMRDGQEPRDLWIANGRSAPEDWVWLAKPGWWGSYTEEQARAMLDWYETLACVPGEPYEWCRVETRGRVSRDG